MYVLEVLPLSVLPPQVPQILSYYHEGFLPKGAVVEVPLNNRTVTAAVVSASDLEEQKMLIRKSLFQLKKVTKIISAEPIIAEWQFKIALWIAQRYVAPLGPCLATVLPPFFLKARYPLKAMGSFATAPTSPPPSWIVTRAQNSHRHIQSFLKNASSGQTLVLVPDASYISYFTSKFDALKPVVITSETPNKEYYQSWNDVANNTTQLIVGTRQALFLPYANLKRVIVIDPLHEFYKSDMSPKYWTPELAQMIATNYGARYIALSSLLSVSAYDKSLRTEIQVSDSMKPWPAKISVIDMAAEIKQGYAGMFAPDARDLIKDTLEKKGNLLVIAARRGYTGILICQRCSYSFKCPNCDLPMRIHQSTTLNLLCHHCNYTQPYPNACPNCHSSQIKPSGPAGSQKIFEELQRMMTYGQIPRAPVMILDADVTKNETEESDVIQELARPSYGDGGAILIATQKVFSYSYDTKFSSIIIPRLDALTVGSDFQTTEKLWYQLEKLADFEPDRILVQTFHQKELLPALARHDYSKLLESELASRKAFWYPPFSRIVKLTFTNNDWRKVTASARAVVEKLKMAVIHIQARDKVQITETSPLFLKKEKGLYTYSIIIKIPTEFPARDLLRYVPAPWRIDIDPRTTT